MWPAFSHSRRVESGTRSCSLRLWPMEVSLSAVPQMIVVGTRPSTSTASNLSSPLKLGKNSATTSNGVCDSMLSTKSTYAAGTSSPNANRSVTTRATERPIAAGAVDGAVPAGQGADGAVGQLAAELGREHRQQDPARVEPARGGRDEADADDPVADQLGVLLGERDDRHAAHRVADQDDRSLGHDVVEDGPEVLPELLDGRVAVGRAAGAAVRALVVVDGADQPAVGRALEVPAVEVEGVAVAEDDGELARPPVELGVELVDLDVEGYAVVGDDRHRPRVQAAERRLVAVAAADGAALPADADRRAGGGQADGTGGGPEDAAAGAHESIVPRASESTYRRVNRPPILVTIS